LLRRIGYDIVPLHPASATAEAPPMPAWFAANEQLVRMYTDGVVHDREGNPIDSDVRTSAIAVEDCLLLHKIVSDNDITRTLEVGMAYGASSLAICEGLRGRDGARHVAMDPFQQHSYDGMGPLIVERAGFNDMFEFYEDYSYRVLPRLVDEGRVFDFIFIDGDHLFDSVLLDFFYADKLLRKGGFVVLHDMDWPSTRKAISFILRSTSYRIAEEYYGSPPRPGERVRRFLRNIRQCPLEPLTWRINSFKMTHLCGVLQKQGDDTRYYTHYKQF
jgi:predicted O-methyltransferase YrrM